MNEKVNLDLKLANKIGGNGVNETMDEDDEEGESESDWKFNQFN